MYVTLHKHRQGMERKVSSIAAQFICFSTFIRTVTNLNICTVFLETDAKNVYLCNNKVRAIHIHFFKIIKSHSKKSSFNYKNRNVQCSHIVYEKLFINFSCFFKILCHFSSFLLVFPVIYVCIQKVISVC
jgi:hypothetical protein